MSKIILGYKLKLYRNIDGKKFVNTMTEEELRKNLDFLDPILSDLGYTKVDLLNISSLEKLEYVENGRLGKKTVERENLGFYEKKDSPDILINAGEHIELQAFSRTKSIEDLYGEIYSLEEKLEEKINFSFDSNFGYLSSRVLNSGTGLKLSLIHI